MNVLTIATLYPKPYNPVRGIFAHQHVLQLRQQGCDGQVISPIPWTPKYLPLSQKWQQYASVPPELELDGIDVHYPRYFRPPGSWFRQFVGQALFWGLRGLISRLDDAKKIDLIHAHLLLPDGSAAIRIAKMLAVPCVCTSWGSDVHTTPFENPRTFSATAYVLQAADQVVTVSQDLKAVADRQFETRNEIHTVYTGVDTNHFRPLASPQAARQELQLDVESPLILFIGHLLRLKGVFELIEAVAEVVKRRSVKLVFVGEGPDRPEIVRMSKQLNIADHVILAGRIGHAEIPTWINAAEMLVLPSYGEGLPNVVLEAMACGRAVVASRVGGIPELVVEDETGLLVPAQDSVALAAAIDALLENQTCCRQMGNRGRQRVLQNFSWERHTSDMLSIYQETIRNYASP